MLRSRVQRSPAAQIFEQLLKSNPLSHGVYDWLRRSRAIDDAFHNEFASVFSDIHDTQRLLYHLSRKEKFRRLFACAKESGNFRTSRCYSCPVGFRSDDLGCLHVSGSTSGWREWANTAEDTKYVAWKLGRVFTGMVRLREGTQQNPLPIMRGGPLLTSFDAIKSSFSNPLEPSPFRLQASQIDAIGEAMLKATSGAQLAEKPKAGLRPLTYLEFRSRLEDPQDSAFQLIMRPLLEHVEAIHDDLEIDMARLADVQHSMVDLLDDIDPDGLFYSRGKRSRIWVRPSKDRLVKLLGLPADARSQHVTIEFLVDVHHLQHMLYTYWVNTDQRRYFTRNGEILMYQICRVFAWMGLQQPPIEQHTESLRTSFKQLFRSEMSGPSLEEVLSRIGTLMIDDPGEQAPTPLSMQQFSQKLRTDEHFAKAVEPLSELLWAYATRGADTLKRLPEMQSGMLDIVDSIDPRGVCCSMDRRIRLGPPSLIPDANSQGKVAAAFGMPVMLLSGAVLAYYVMEDLGWAAYLAKVSDYYYQRVPGTPMLRAH